MRRVKIKGVRVNNNTISPMTNPMMNPNHLRVAIISQRYYPLIGGIEHQQSTLAPLLRERGLDVQIFTKQYPGLKGEEIINGVPVHRFPIPGPRPVASISFTLHAQMALSRFKPDVIHAHEVFSPGTTALLAKALFRVPIAISPSCSGEFGEFSRLQNQFMGSTRISLLRKYVDQWVAKSTEIDQELTAAGIGAARHFFMANGVDTNHFHPVDKIQKQQRRRALGLPDGPLIVYTGRLEHQKRVDLLIDAWKMLNAEQRFSGNVIIVGTGSLESDLKARATPDIHFIGPVDDVSPYLEAADIFVLPSNAEGISGSMLEAMATGLAIVVTNVGAASSVVTPMKNGILIPSGDAQSLKQALDLLLSHPTVQAQLGENARRHVEKHYSITSVCDKLVTFYQSLAMKNIQFTRRLHSSAH
jgi:glycosyltransferase involved in cell wall biosynthesis